VSAAHLLKAEQFVPDESLSPAGEKDRLETLANLNDKDPPLIIECPFLGCNKIDRLYEGGRPGIFSQNKECEKCGCPIAATAAERHAAHAALRHCINLDLN
jgi:hypothetical protein